MGVTLRQSADSQGTRNGSKEGGDIDACLGNYSNTLRQIISITPETGLGLRGRHLRGKISLGTAYANGTDAKPTPTRILAPIKR